MDPDDSLSLALVSLKMTRGPHLDIREGTSTSIWAFFVFLCKSHAEVLPLALVTVVLARLYFKGGDCGPMDAVFPWNRTSASSNPPK